MSKWQEDLLSDIRTGNDNFDWRDGPESIDGHPWDAISGAFGYAAVLKKFLEKKDTCFSILEIGVNVHGFTEIFTTQKNLETVYIGIDIENREYLNNVEKNIYTIERTSEAYDENLARINEIGVTQFDFIYIDGLHSINHVLHDWEYSRLLAPGGIIGFHDTRFHPGPKRFLQALNKDTWNIEENACANDLDWGVGFVWKK